MRTDFYATRTDCELVLRAVEARRHLKYFAYGVFETPTPPVFSSGLEIPDLGIATEGDYIREKQYVVLEAAAELQAERFELVEGGTRYAVSQLGNPTSIIFQPAGLLNEHCIIRGEISTLHRDPASVALYRGFARSIKKHFTSIHGYWVGPEALQRFRTGARLTLDARLRMYDLKPLPLSLPSSIDG